MSTGGEYERPVLRDGEICSSSVWRAKHVLDNRDRRPAESKPLRLEPDRMQLALPHASGVVEQVARWHILSLGTSSKSMPLACIQGGSSHKCMHGFRQG